MGNPPANVRNRGKGEVFVLQHREYLGDILSGGTAPAVGPSPFNLQSFSINPGNVLTFPWASQIAANFQEYKINGMGFYYKSLSSDAVATSNTSAALGDVIMSTNYDASRPLFANKQQMLEAEYSSDGKPSMSKYHMIETARKLTPVDKLYVRTGVVPAGTDPRLYDLGIFQIATQGAQAQGVQLGELWVTYEIWFYKPILGGSMGGQSIASDHFRLAQQSAAVPLGLIQQLAPGSSIGGTINGATGTTYTFPARITSGTYLVLLNVNGVSAAVTFPPPTVSAGTNILLLWSSSGGGADSSGLAVAPSIGAASPFVVVAFILQIVPGSSLPVVVSFAPTGGTLPTTPVFGDLFVTQTNSNILT